MSNRFQNFEQIRDCVNNLIACIPEHGKVDLQPLFFRLTFDTTTFLLFGQQMSSLKSEGIASRESDFAHAFTLAQGYLADRGRLGKFYWLVEGREFRNACKTCHAFVDAAVGKALEKMSDAAAKDSRKENYIFLDALVRDTRDPKVLRDQCLNILLAGRDTTACCLSWTLCVFPCAHLAYTTIIFSFYCLYLSFYIAPSGNLN
jgi:cytochrome P450